MPQKHVAILNFHGDPNVGLYGAASDTFCLLGKSVSAKHVAEIQEALKVPVIQAGLYGTDLIGLFAAVNSHAVLLPEIIYKSELKVLKEKLKELDVKILTIKTEHTAFGNNLLLNDKVGIASKVYSKSLVAKIQAAFGIKLKKEDIAGLAVPGSTGIITNKGGLFSPNLTDKDIKLIENLFKFEIGLGTVNMGNPFVSSGVIANSNGFVVGAHSSGYEIARIDESLGFLR